jgi:hypothetical protein
VALTLIPNPDASDQVPTKISDYHVMHGGMQIGRIYKRAAAISPASQWIWAINGLLGCPDTIRLSGTVGSLEEAAGAFLESWDSLLAWGQLAETVRTDAKWYATALEARAPRR